MVPSTVMLLGRLPLTASGKLDRRALPSPPAADAARPPGDRVPRTIREHVLCALLADAAHRPAISMDENFFEAGVHSLLAVKLVPAIRAAVGGGVAVSDVLRDLTVASLIERFDNTAHGGAYEALLPLRLQGSRSPLFCVHADSGLGWTYAALLEHVDRPVYALQARDLPATVTELAADHLSRIRSMQRTGPYRLAGCGASGAIVREIAAQLEELGETLDFAVVAAPFPATVHDPLKTELARLTPGSPISDVFLRETADGHSTAEALRHLLTNHTPRPPKTPVAEVPTWEDLLTYLNQNDT
jgi:hypothetical protein